MVRMYNCWFGDCFRIYHDPDDTAGNDLIVDFGIHPNCRSRADREARFDLIYNDFFTGHNSDFLLTHYHADHYNGVIYASQHGVRFENVYIPDIWGKRDSIPVIVILLLGLFTDRYIEENLTLFDFFIAICNINNGIIHLNYSPHSGVNG